MCRDGFRQQCEEPGCEEIVTCRDSPRLCTEHDPLVEWYRSMTEETAAES